MAKAREKMKEMATKKHSNKGKEYSFHDLKSGQHRHADYSEVRSSLKKNYGNKAHRTVREMAQNLTPNTSEVIPSSGGYYSRRK